MSAQPTSIIIGPRVGQSHEAAGVGDLQRIVYRVLSILSRRRWLFVFPLLTGLLGTLIVTLFVPRLYKVAAVLERRDDPVLTELIQNNSPFSFVPQRRSLVMDLRGREAAMAVIEEVGLLGESPRGADGTLTAAAQDQLQRHLADILPNIRVKLAEKGPELDIIEITYMGQYPERGALLVNGLKDRYVATIEARINGIYKDSHKFFQSLTEENGQRATELQVEQGTMLAEHPGISPTNPNELEDLLERANGRVEDLTVRQGELKDRIAYYQDYLGDLERQAPASQPASEDTEVATVWIPNPRRSELTRSIAQIQSQITDAEVAKGMLKEHPQMQTLLRQLQQLRIEYQSEPVRIEQVRSFEAPSSAVDLSAIDQKRKRAQMDLSSLQKNLQQNEQELAEMQAEIATYQEELGGLPDRRAEYVALERKLDRVQADYTVWSGHVGELERVIKADSKDCGIHFGTMQPAYVPDRPFSPTVFGVFLLAAGIGLGLAAAAVFLREMFDRSLRDPNRVRQVLGIPVLETIGEIRGTSSGGAMARRVLVGGFVTVEALLVVATGALVYLSVLQPSVYKDATAAVFSLFSR